MMKRWTISAATALALVLPFDAAWALTPEEVWENWKAGVTAGGGTVTATSEAREGEALVISGLETRSGDDGAPASVQMQAERLTLTGRDDGTVLMTMSDVIQVEYEMRDRASDARAFKVEIRQTGAETIASGTPDEVSYDYKMAGFEAKLISLTDETGTAQDVQALLTGAALNGTYQVQQKEGRPLAIRSAMDLGPMSLTVSGTDAGTEAAAGEGARGFAGTVTLASLTTVFNGDLLPAEKLVDIRAALSQGLAFDSQLQFGALAAQFDFTGDTKAGFTAKLDGGDLAVLLDAARMAYGVSFMGGDIRVNAPAEGLTDVGGGFAETTIRVAMPIATDGLSRDFSMLTRLVDVTVSDYIWGFADPASQLSRDPATLILDLAGKGAWLGDVFGGGLAPHGSPAAPPGAPPGRVDQVELKEVLAKALGAQLDARGALSFDNSDTTTFPGFPTPNGTITVNLAGVSALLDKLVALGVVSPGDLTGIRMGLAMFTRPGAGPDQLTTELEFRDKGLFVNGQQIL